MSDSSRNGLLAAAGSYLLWGFLPIYWKILGHIPSFEILCHRIAWSFLFVAVILAIRKQHAWIPALHSNPMVILHFTLSAVLLAANWFIYIWGVNNNFIVETSLGYFINPLVNVLLGVVLLKERLRPVQWGAVGLAAAGVLYLTIQYGSFPWISITLACTFAFYGYLRKTGALGSLEGLSLETALLALPAAAYLFWLGKSGGGAFGNTDVLTHIMLILAGAATSIPLLLFAYGAQKVNLSTMGFLQFFAPSIQLAIGVFMYHEPFDETRLKGFMFIWVALAIYTIDRVLQLSVYNKQR
jgi:chloramphenicol-sensitive protein RarD